MKSTKAMYRELELRRLELRGWVEDAATMTASEPYREVCERQAEVCRAKIELLEWVLGEPREEEG